MKPSRGLVWGVSVLLTLYGLLALRGLYHPPRGAVRFESSYTARLPDGSERVSPEPWYSNSTRDRGFLQGAYSWRFRLPPGTHAPDPDSWYSLVLPSVSGNAVRARLDGATIGTQGDFERGRSNIWNSPKTFAIPPGALLPDSVFEVEVLGVYCAGILETPFLLKTADHEVYLFALGILGDDVIGLLCGAVLFISMVLIALGLSPESRPDARFYLGLAAAATGLFLTDFMTFPYLPMPLLEFKRAVAILRHAAAALFPLGFLLLIGRGPGRFGRVFLTLQAAAALALLVPRSMPDLKILYSYTYLLVLPLPFYLIALLRGARGDGRDYALLVYGAGVGSACFLYDSLAAFLWPREVPLSHLGFAVLVASTFLFIVRDILAAFRQVVVERDRAERYKEKSLRDPLTGAFNRGVLPLISEELSGTFSVICLDVDQFKSINDRFGHAVGDLVLRDLVDVLDRTLRKGDRVVRTGGDEFLVVLPECPESRALSIAETLRKEIAGSAVEAVHGAGYPEAGGSDPETGTVRYEASVGTATWNSGVPRTPEDLREILDRADRDLYSRKSARSS